LNANYSVVLQPGVFSPGKDVNTLTLYQNQGATTNQASFSYYYTTPITTFPTISVTFNYITAPSIPISGINIVYGNPTFTITATCGNMGEYFYSAPIASFTTACGASSNTINENNLNNVTSGKDSEKITGNITIQTSNTSLNIGNEYSQSITLSGVANNIRGRSSPAANAPQLVTIYDAKSFNLVRNILPYYTTGLPGAIPSLSQSVSTRTGFRMTNPYNMTNINNLATLITTYLKWDVDDSVSLTTTNNRDLQIAQGVFCTKGSGKGYLNYAPFYYSATLQNTLDYSGIDPTNEPYRYAMFVWNVAAASSQYGNLTFSIYGTPNTLQNKAQIGLVDGVVPIQLYYRFENPSFPTPTNGTSISSQWANGNSVSGTFFDAGTYWFLDPATTPGIRPALLSLTTGSTVEYKVFVPPFLSAARLYCIIGLPMSRNYYFSHIQATLTS
jgi:hypothetical protein